MAVLPIFELPLVLLPGERIPLHIFEERYQRMTAHCLERSEPFGIVLRDDEGGARAIGCSAEITEVTERYDDGRLDIVVDGLAPFRVLDRFEGEGWPAGEVEELDELELPSADLEQAERARALFSELAERVTGEAPDAEGLADAGAYAIAARIELPVETKQVLLESRDEEERMTMLANALGALRAALERGEVIAARARSNGRVAIDGRPG